MTVLGRKTLVDLLGIVSPAISTREIVPILGCYWFTGETLLAYNDQIAISVPCKTDFAGAVPRTLIYVLQNSKHREVEFTVVNGALQGRLGSTGKDGKFRSSSKFTLPLLPAEDFLFEMPPLKAKALDDATAGMMLRSMEGCSRSFGAKDLIAEHLGMTIAPNGKGAELFATNGSTISRAHVKDLKCDRRVIVPTSLCKQVLLQSKEAEKITFVVGTDHVLMKVDDVLFFSRLLDSDKPLDFAGVINTHFPSKLHKDAVEKPEGITDALRRAQVILGDEKAAEFTTDKGRLKIEAKSGIGEMSESLKVGLKDGLKARFDPKLLLAGIDEFEELLVTDGCCIMTKPDGQIYLVAARGA